MTTSPRTLSDRLRARADIWEAAHKATGPSDDTIKVMREAADALDEAKRALEQVKLAWEALSVGNHSPCTVETWLRDKMKPAIDVARAILAKLKATREIK